MIVFLDFDGVLHPELTPEIATSGAYLFCRLPLIENVLREFPRVEIVISSTWRLKWNQTVAIVELRKHFSSDIAGRVIGVNPNYIDLDREKAPDGLDSFHRQWECEMWLRAHRPAGTPWLALDDRAYMFRPFCKNLMALDRKIAFTADNQIELRARLTDSQSAFDLTKTGSTP